MDNGDAFLNDPSQERDAGGEPPSESVVLAVADATDRSPIDLPPLHDVLDPDALDDLFASTLDGRPRSNGHLSFEYCDCHVVVFGDGRVLVDSNT